ASNCLTTIRITKTMTTQIPMFLKRLFKCHSRRRSSVASRLAGATARGHALDAWSPTWGHPWRILAVSAGAALVGAAKEALADHEHFPAAVPRGLRLAHV